MFSDEVCLAGGGKMGAVMRSIDASKTPIGPVESWSPALQMMVRVLLVQSARDAYLVETQILSAL